MKSFRLLTFTFLLLSVISSALATDWEIVRSPSSGKQANSLASVAAVADNDVWTVGWSFSQQLNAYRTEIQHWNGTSWSLVRSPNATNGYNFLNGVAVVAANDVWTVGQAANGSTYSTLIEHWNGSTWDFVPRPDKKNPNNRLHGITVTPNGTLWAVGTTGVFARPERTFVLRKTP